MMQLSGIGNLQTVFRIFKRRSEYVGSALVFRKGKILDVFEDLKKDFNINAVYSHQETGNAWTFERDKSVRYWGRVNGVKILEYQNNAIIRGLLNRDNGINEISSCQKTYHRKAKYKASEIDLAQISVDIDFRGNSVKNNQQIGGVENGWKHLKVFFSGTGQ